MGFPDLLLQRY